MKNRFLSPLVSAVALFVVAGCGGQRDSAESAGGADVLPAVRVQTAAVVVRELPATIEVAGTVRPVQRAQVAAKVMGVIEELPVTLGQQVSAGEVLVRIAAGEVSARVEQARAQLNGARRDLERERALLIKGASTTETVKNLEDRLVANEAQLREAEVMLGYAEVRAPFDGVVARRPVNAGDLATPGVLLLEIEGTSRFEIEAGVPESAASQLKIGSPMRIKIPAGSVSFEGSIAEISSAADPEARTVLVKIAVPEDMAVRSGQFVRVEVPGEVRKALLVPASAVTRFGQMERVFSIGPQNRAVLHLVKTAGVRDEHVEIVAGLSVGDRVIVNPPAGLREGQLTEVIRE
ncbi:MAG TPA: efflux RND transporter periplasmic adaptor subunit [Opitutus sp.]|nr:efflux RND transporter periplasmic adaptor subunit [Opitutus sp.]